MRNRFMIYRCYPSCLNLGNMSKVELKLNLFFCLLCKYNFACVYEVRNFSGHTTHFYNRIDAKAHHLHLLPLLLTQSDRMLKPFSSLIAINMQAAFD